MIKCTRSPEFSQYSSYTHNTTSFRGGLPVITPNSSSNGLNAEVKPKQGMDKLACFNLVISRSTSYPKLLCMSGSPRIVK